MPENKSGHSQERKREERDFIRIAQVSSTVGIGALAAFVASVEQVSPRLKFGWNWMVPLTAVAAAVIAWLMWTAFLVPEPKPQGPLRNRRSPLRIGTLILLLTLLGFGYALRDLPGEKLIGVATGTLAAFLILGLMGCLFWQIVKFLEADQKLHSHSPTNDNEKDRNRNG